MFDRAGLQALELSAGLLSKAAPAQPADPLEFDPALAAVAEPLAPDGSTPGAPVAEAPAAGNPAPEGADAALADAPAVILPEPPPDAPALASNAAAAVAPSAGLESFSAQVATGQAGVLTGVYVEGILALRIVSQPHLDVGYVSMEPGTATQFQSASPYGVFGLLAHNFLSGSQFFNLQPGHEVTLVFGDGVMRRYQVTQIGRYERLTRSDLRSDFLDLDSGQTFSADAVFERYYRGNHHLTLQTCIEKNGVWNWGVQFIVAEPVG